jgi:hypothetical protein
MQREVTRITQTLAKGSDAVSKETRLRALDQGKPLRALAVRASVRVSPNGEVLNADGDVEMFGALVAYVTRLSVVLGTELGLEPFDSLHAELGGERLVVFADGPDTVGLLLRAGATAQELRKQLGH